MYIDRSLCGDPRKDKMIDELNFKNCMHLKRIQRRKSRIDKINEEVKGWTYSSKQQEYPPERTNTKEETSLEQTKRKLKYQP